MLVNWQKVDLARRASGWVPGWGPAGGQRVLRDTYDRQFKFTGVTGVSKIGMYSTTAVLEY